MLTSIQLDDEPMLKRGKVRYVRTDRHLPAKFHTSEPATTQELPHSPFGIGTVRAEGSRHISLLTFAQRCCPHPARSFAARHPLPQAGEGIEARFRS